MINATRAGLTGLVGLALAVALIAAPASNADSQPDELLPGHVAIVKPGKLAKFVAKPPSPSVFSLPDASNDPGANGGTLDFFDTVPRPDGDFTFALPAGGGWTRIGSASNVKGYKYKGAGTPSDPCTVVLIKPKVVKAVCKGTAVGFTLPFDGDLGVVLTIGSAKRYCADFGGTSSGNPATVFKQKDAPAPGVCPSDATPTPSPTATPTGTAAATILISEVRTRGAGGASDEFVELYNPSGTGVVLDTTWTLKERSTTASTYTTRWTSSGAVIPAYGHYLIAGTAYTQMPSADASLSAGITDDGSLLLLHSAAVVDVVCMYYDSTTQLAFSTGTPPYTCAGSPVMNPHNNGAGTNVDASIERKPGGLSGNGQDTGDNASDFSTAMPANPQDLASPPTP